jgi:guanylate kinase
MIQPPPASVPRNPAAPLLILISAPSGGGKTTLCQQLLAKHPEMTRAVTCTTRAPRPGERDGVDYYFLDAAAFARRVAGGGFLEHATVYGHSYGTPKSEVLERLGQGHDVLLNIDVQGAASICTASAQDADLRRALVTVFLTPASLAELDTRLRRRATDAEVVLQKRLNTARQEIAQWQDFSYLIISTTIAEDLRRMECIIEAERMRHSRALPPG